MAVIHTIGYATKPIDVFLSQLRHHAIDVVADIRSVPYSKAFPDYHQEAVAEHLAGSGIRYVYLGKELGPRSSDPNHYDERGQVQFDRLQCSQLFADGIERLLTGSAKGYSIALMCAEKDPARCHRSLLVGHYLVRATDDNSEQVVPAVEHITYDGALESQQQLEQRLVSIHSLEQDLFLSNDEREEQAYRAQLRETSYVKPF